MTPAVIPSDLQMSVSTFDQTSGHFVQIDEIEIVPLLSPYMNNVARGSYVDNPEAFDGVTGTFGPSDDPSPMQCMTLIRNNLILHTAEGILSPTADNDSEPGDWVVNSISRSVGALSFRGCDASKTGTGDAGEEVGSGCGPCWALHLSQAVSFTRFRRNISRSGTASTGTPVARCG